MARSSPSDLAPAPDSDDQQVCPGRTHCIENLFYRHADSNIELAGTPKTGVIEE